MSKQKKYCESWSPQWKFMINEERKAKYLAQKTVRELEKEAEKKARAEERKQLEEAREAMKKSAPRPVVGRSTDEIMEMLKAETLKKEQENADSESNAE